MHLGAALRVLPKPQRRLDMDQTILLHQAQASGQKNQADVLLVGGSSCLMDVAARDLETQLAPRHHVLNLGTLSYLNLEVFGELVRRYASVNTGRLRSVVVLLHPEMLRRNAVEA